jgi:hypothetical protein
MKGLERSSEQYSYPTMDVPVTPIESVDQFVDRPHHFYASSYCTWKTSYSLAEVIKFMEKEGNSYTVWYVPVPDEANYEIKRYAPQVEGAFVLDVVVKN